jgi:hypothetical protein
MFFTRNQEIISIALSHIIARPVEDECNYDFHIDFISVAAGFASKLMQLIRNHFPSGKYLPYLK